MSIVVIGDIILDDYRVVSVDRVSPEAPCLIGKAVDKYYRLGGAANVANNVKVLDPSVLLVGQCSAKTETIIRESGIRSLTCDGANSVKTRFIDKKSGVQLFRYDTDSLYAEGNEIIGRVDYSSHKVCVIVDYLKGMIDFGPHFPHGCETNIVSTKNRSAASVAPVVGKNSILVVNAEEFKCLMSYGAYKYIVRTEGKDGITILNNSLKLIRHLPAISVEVFDVTGAGDTVTATLAYCINEFGFSEENLIKACYVANITAGDVIRIRGTSVIRSTSEEVKQLFRSYNV